MFKTLYGKLAAVLLGLLCLIGVLYIALTLLTTQMYLQEVNQKLNQSLAQHLVTEKILMKEGRVNKEALDEIFHMLMVINPSIEVYLLNPKGRILAFSAPPEKVKRETISLKAVKTFLGHSAIFPILGEDPRDLNRKKVFSVSPIPQQGPVQGYLYIILGGEEYDSVAQMLQGSYILRLSAWTAAGSLLIALLAGLVLFNRLTRRLRKLTASMETFRQNDFIEHPNTSRSSMNRLEGDEIDRLEATFTQMANCMNEQVNRLKQTDQLRRELVANVSHDLRTPLASLQGYIDTLLLKEGTLTPQQQRHYLEIAAKHSERLGKLVSELFELAKLDAHETQLHLELFSIGELVQDIVQKFSFVAQNRQVHLKTDFRKDLPFVMADIGLVERVFENLIENALRFTPEGGSVTVKLIREDQSILTQVTDTGCGIPSEDLPYIFDRFYRVEKTLSARAGGAGLGLAIAKRILELHGSPIEATSTVNIGTTFTFHLPIHRINKP